MSRSRKKSPYVKNCGTSNKFDKTNSHRKERKAVRSAIDANLESVEMIHEYGFSDPWLYNTDGVRRWDDPRAYRK